MKRVLVTGHAGFVGSRFLALAGQDYDIIRAGRSNSDVFIDLTDNNSIAAAISRAQPDVVINFAAISSIDECEKEAGNLSGYVYKTNVLGPKYLALACKQNGARMIQISTDFVFSGKKETAPYEEIDSPDPINWYGRTKYAAELEVIKELPGACVARIKHPFAANFPKKKDLIRTIIQTLKSGQEFIGIADNKMNPTFCDDIAVAIKKLISANSSGIYHLAGASWHSAYEIGLLVAGVFGLDKSKVIRTTLDEFSAMSKWTPRAKYSWVSIKKFTNEFGETFHDLPSSLKIMKKQMELV